MKQQFIVIIPTFNRSDILRRALNSVKNQPYENWLCLIGDDDSKDDTASVVQRYMKNDSRFVYIKMDKNSGVNATRNKLIDYAENRFSDAYLTMLDDDDYFVSDFFPKVNSVINNTKDQNWFGFNCVTEQGKKITRIKKYGYLSYIDDLMFGKNWRGDATPFIHLSLLNNIRFTTRFRNSELWFFWAKLSLKSRVLMVDIDGSVKDYLPGGITKTGFNRGKAIEVQKYKLEILAPIVGEERLVHQMVTLSKNLYLAGNKAEAKACLKKVFRLKPFYLRQYPHWIKQYFSR